MCKLVYFYSQTSNGPLKYRYRFDIFYSSQRRPGRILLLLYLIFLAHLAGAAGKAAHFQRRKDYQREILYIERSIEKVNIIFNGAEC